ncbi:MAG: GNAT family N-acetyltransferase [Planctomycetota bacterium]|jgi:predicted GNAT family N-acyltransferase
MMRRSKLDIDDFTVSVVSWSDRQAELIYVRRAVFIEEQNVPESIEIDGKDPDCFHVLACDGAGTPIGTARLTKSGKIGRMAVLPEYRGLGVGARILRTIIDYGISKGIADFHLSAQISAVGFYKKMGFEPYGEEFQEAGIKHINMRQT